jgi:uncharacterized protein
VNAKGVGSEKVDGSMQGLDQARLRALAERGNPLAQFALGWMLESGTDVDRDEVEAASWYRRAGEQGNTKAQFNLGCMFDEGRGVKQDGSKAVEWFRKAAEQGDADAQYNLGILYYDGDGVDQDDAKAAEWFQKAAEQGTALAQYNLGFMYNVGRGVKQDDARAAEWFQKAAEQGTALAQYNLGVMYDVGLGVKQDDVEAAACYDNAAGQGVIEAQYRLGLMYVYGRGVKQDDTKAAEWFRKAAAQGNTKAAYVLGVITELGVGVERDLSEACRWYELAAKSGDPIAQFRLGNILFRGRGVAANPTEAAKWLSMSAEQCNAEAECLLGQIYEQGVGVTKDPIKAKEFLERASDHGSSEAKERLEKAAPPERRATDELDELIGIRDIKDQIRKLQARLWWQKQRVEKGFKPIFPSLHMVFTGNPGTGKTTVARIVAKIYRETEILPKGHLVEVDRSALIGEYLGQTAPKTAKVVESSFGGVLFIDEVYSLVARNSGFQDAYGEEAISAILKMMEDNRDKFALIVAGYPDEMNSFWDSNPGLRSRFSRYIHFPDYTAEELGQIFRQMLMRAEMECAADALKIVDGYFVQAVNCRDKKSFGNAREAQAVMDLAIECAALRLKKTNTTPSKSELQILTKGDFEFLSERPLVATRQLMG